MTAFISPILSGILYDHIGFSDTTLILGACNLLMVSLEVYLEVFLRKTVIKSDARSTLCECQFRLSVRPSSRPAVALITLE